MGITMEHQKAWVTNGDNHIVTIRLQAVIPRFGISMRQWDFSITPYRISIWTSNNAYGRLVVKMFRKVAGLLGYQVKLRGRRLDQTKREANRRYLQSVPLNVAVFHAMYFEKKERRQNGN